MLEKSPEPSRPSGIKTALVIVAVELALVGGVVWLARGPVPRVNWTARPGVALMPAATVPVARSDQREITPWPVVAAKAQLAGPVPTMAAATPQLAAQNTEVISPPTTVAATPSPAPPTVRHVVPTPTDTAVPLPTETTAPIPTAAPTTEPPHPLLQAEEPMASAAGVPSQPEEPVVVGLPDDVTDEQVIGLAQRINQARAEAGLPSLAWCPELALAARVHAEDMASHGFVSHTGSDGSDLVERMRRAGYEPAFRGEIIAWVPGGYELAFSGWWESQVHHATMLGEAYRDFGIARVPHPTRAGHNYFVVVFGRR